MDLNLYRKHVLVTASTSGIGRAVAIAFLREGSIVIINGRDEKKTMEVASTLSDEFGERNVLAFVGNLLDETVIKSLAEFVDTQLGHLDILVSNLGSGRPKDNNQLNTEEWKRLFEVNLFSSAKVVDGMMPYLEKEGNSSVVFVSSITGMEFIPAPYGYRLAKGSLLMLAKSLSRDLAHKKIRVNCIVPGNVYFEGGRWEELIAENPNVIVDYIEKEVPMGRFATPEEIANSVVFIASPASSFTTGAALVIDGGQTRSF